MINACVQKILFIVILLIKTNDQPYTARCKVRNVVRRCQGGTVPFGILYPCVGWPRKGQDFLLKDPIQITILFDKKEGKVSDRWSGQEPPTRRTHVHTRTLILS